MRRLIFVTSLVAALSLLTQPAVAQTSEPPPVVGFVPPEAPEGFVDGLPVGADDVEALSGSAATTTVERSATGRRYFGAGAWEAIEQAAADTSRTCGLTDAGLVGLVVAPVFKESSAATTPASAPSPMTLSRYDEWNGNYSTTSNSSANYTLYESRNPHTPYPRAFWHPGVGIWQYDSAGVGAPYTAMERMNVRIIAGDIAAGMAQRYCNPPSSIMGPGPYTNAQRRQAAWWPWWTGQPSCPLCQVEFDNMMSTSPQFARITKVPGISATGGAVARTCTIGEAVVECWYIDPSIGVVEGANWWAGMNPLDGGSPTVAPTPLTAPFYVVKRGGHEERHWLRADTGYPVDISARRQLGRNARVRSNQTGSGLAWSRSSGLCDVEAGSGQCTVVPSPVTGVRSTPLSISGTYRPVVGDFNGDGRSDILWYGPGADPDSMWHGVGSARFSNAPVNVSHRWDDVLAADINGDRRDDVVFYNRSTGQASLWVWQAGGGFRSQRINPGPGRQPLVGDFTGDGTQNILWYGPGALSDSMWSWTGGSVRVTPTNVSGHYQPIVGDFDGNGVDDIFWYGPGAAPDSTWLHQRGGGYRVLKRPVSGVYDTVVGDFDGDGRDDIVWIDRSGTSRIWFAFVNANVVSQTFVVTQPYEALVVDLQGDGRDDLLWYDPSGSGQLWTRWSGGRARTSVSYTASGGLIPLVGSFSVGGGDGILWYGPGAAPDAMWWR